jgi:hypothetical protein
MSLLSRWERLPAPVRRLLADNERVLAMAHAEDTVVVATQLGLWLPMAADEPTWRRIGWDRVVKATWTDHGLSVIEADVGADGLITDLPTVTVRLAEPRNLPTVVRTRVENSIARSEQVRVPGGTARVVARRVPGRDGVSWTARVDSGTPDTDEARSAMREYLSRVVVKDDGVGQW